MIALNGQNTIVIALELVGLLISLTVLYLCILLLIKTSGKLKKSFEIMFLGVVIYNILKLVKLFNYLYGIIDQNTLNIVVPILGSITFLFFIISLYKENKLFNGLLNNKK